MLYRVRSAWYYFNFNRITEPVLRTAPIQAKDSALRILSMVAERDIQMFLTSAKVFYRRIGHGRFHLIIDRDLPQDRRDLLRRHLSGAVDFVTLEDIDVGRCQRGGTWERLLSCVDLAANHYVVQMDADTLAIGDIPEVHQAIAGNRAFTLVEGAAFKTMDEAGADAERQHTDNHIVNVTERAFRKHPERHSLRYVRGSSGFAGFAQGGVSRSLVEDFHAAMEAIVGPARWREWGTEQVASNFTVANSPDPLALPWPDYCTVVASTDLKSVRFGHFIGSDRFVGQRLAHTGAATMLELL
jgi:hypothetical protein